MISALFYLQFNSVRNRLRARLRRLKQPKYLVGAVLGGGYLIFYFSFLLFRTDVKAGGLLANGVDLPTLENVGAAILFLIMLLGWVLPNQRAALAFTETEVAFLFPAPITRRQLVQYKLLRSQASILLSAFFFSLIWGRRLPGGHIWISVLGWWIVLSTINLHRLAISFARTMLFERGLTDWRWRVIILAAVAALVGYAIKSSEADWANLPPWQDSLWPWLGAVLSAGVTPHLLYPFRLVVMPLLAPDAAAFLHALGPALGIMIVHYFIILRADVAFEEASVAYSQKIAARLANFQEQRSGRIKPKKARRAPFPLAPTGLASVAFLWKNLILAGNIFTLRTFLLLAWFVFLGVSIIGSGHGHADGAEFAGILCVMLFMMSLLAGQTLLRADFRADLNLVDQLKLYPLPGWQVVLGELLAPVVILAAAQWLLILAAALLLAPADGSVPLSLRVTLALGAAILAPVIDLVMLIIPNAFALLLPSWVRFDQNAPRGFENIGQRLILVFGQMFAMFFALVPAGLVFWLTFAIAGLVLGATLALPLAALAAATVLGAEGGCAIYFLGAAFESFDLTAETIN